MFRHLWLIYYDGFRYLPRWGKILTAIVGVKLLILFFVFKLWLMPDYLDRRYTDEQEKIKHVIRELTTKP